MQKIINLYKNNSIFRFNFDLWFIFVLLQIIYGFVLSINSTNFVNYKFCSNLVFLSFVIWSFNLLLIDAKKINSTFYKNTVKFGIAYWIISIFLTSFLFMQIQTIFSYLGMMLGNLTINDLLCDHLCLTFRFILTGNIFN